MTLQRSVRTRNKRIWPQLPLGLLLVVLAVSPTFALNLVTNESYESGLDDWIFGPAGPCGQGGLPVVSTAEAFQGNNSLLLPSGLSEVTCGTQGDYGSGGIPVEEGTVYITSVWALVVGEYIGGPTFPDLFNPNFEAAQFLHLVDPDTSTPWISEASGNAPTVWTKYSNTFDTTGWAAEDLFVSIEIWREPGASGAVYVDSWSIRVVPEPATGIMLVLGMVPLLFRLEWRRRRARRCR